MKRAEHHLPTLHFRGVPVALDSLVGIAQGELGPALRISIDHLALSHVPLGFLAFDAGAGASRLRMSIPRGTPPGNYKGSAEAGGKSYPVEIDVESYVHLSLSPRQLILSAHAGDKLHVDLTLANSGNVVSEIGITYAFGLYDVHGAERGIGAAFRSGEGNGVTRVVRLLDQLAEGHGGIVRVQVEEGAGSIAAGEVRPLRLNLHLPTMLKAGHTYTGTMPMENLRYYVKVHATSERK